MPTVTIPSTNINRESGTLLLKVTNTVTPTEKETLLSVGPYILFFENRTLVLSSDTKNTHKTLSLSALPFPGTATIIWSWIKENHRLITVSQAGEVTEQLFENTALSERFDTIQLANKPFWKGSYQELRIFASDLLYENISDYDLKKFQENEETLFHADYRIPTHYKKEPVVETTMAPRDQSPIILEDSQGAMNRQYFFDTETGEYQSRNTETFIYAGEDILHLSYGNLDPDFNLIVKFYDGETFQAYHTSKTLPEGALMTFDDNQLFLRLSYEQKEKWYGEEVSVTYQVARSYIVEYNEDVAHDSLRVKLVNHKDKELTLTQEGNRFSNQRLTKEIELNPLVNARHTGFIYIDKEEQYAQAFRLNASSNYINANGFDTADFMVEAIDAEGNEVLSPYIDVFLMNEQGKQTDELGEITPVISYDTLKARNSAGRCYFEYHAPLITQKDNPYTQRVFAVAYDRRTGIGAQFPLIIRPSESDKTSVGKLSIKKQTAREATLPFEYMARYFERKLSKDSPVNALDFDGDGVITRNDLDIFLNKKYNKNEMQELNHILKESEVF